VDNREYIVFSYIRYVLNDEACDKFSKIGEKCKRLLNVSVVTLRLLSYSVVLKLRTVLLTRVDVLVRLKFSTT
jgi:hypothetical protein